MTHQTKSKIFATPYQAAIEQGVISLINKQKDFMSARTINSPRAVGDAIQEMLGSEFNKLVPKNILKDYTPSFARRAMADFAFTDMDCFYYMVDTKTHNLETAFNMPNLTSVARLLKLYEKDQNYFTLLLLSYKVKGDTVVINDCHFVPIEHLDWSCLRIGALGKGQIQISDSNKLVINQKTTRKEWMLQLCDKMLEFYPKEIKKINARFAGFKKSRKLWEKHDDI